MKAAVVTELGAPLQVRDTSVPLPGPGQVLVRIETSRLCHTGIHTRIVVRF
jgi:alcohol dehydrogenase, propanol-preferring